MKKYFITLSLIICEIIAVAQNETDALRYSNTQRASTARSLAMGSSFGALGADLSSFFSNPAGVGLYKRGGVEFSLGLNNNSSTAKYEGSERQDYRSHLTINNFGIVGAKKTKKSDWLNVNFGIAYAKTNNFFENITIAGSPRNTSIMEAFASQASGIHPDAITDALPFGAGLAYQVYGINPQDTAGLSYVSAVGSGLVNQSKTITRSGSQNETSFAFGANYRDILMIGGSINFTNARFLEQSTYKEVYESDESLANMTYHESLNSEGNGIGIKIGMISKPAQWLRIGAAYHSPTVIGFRDLYHTDMNSAEQNGTQYNWASPDLISNYSIRTPAKYIANMAFVLGKSGVIAADYEYTDFNNMNLRGTGNNNYDYATENDVIKQIYRGVHKASAGVEWRIAKTFALRGGAIYQQSPFVNGIAENNSYFTYTGGFGYRTDYFYCDFAASYVENDETYYMYQTINNNPASIQKTKLNFLLSTGFRF